ncbi:DUF2290 domain-containing protein [Ochrobactrum teleogrylli]|uniref:DUF2290 domain-containing protein n=1 Tax=Ochrobactrum teleogrylli TaxID=2479765 RepID=A0ABY2Y8W7_9HYPH|nr:DUF2290 domain-containing protein [[Ochrobactrum] teleogrylli]TNV18380.1 DUF2290 domain-containing protein [[Ochrobactrum] teleogrylli]
MPSPETVKKQIDSITADLIETGLSSKQNFSILRTHPEGVIDVTTEKYTDMSLFMKDISYVDMYNGALEGEQYNIAMVDGALIQMQYRFVDGVIHKHRLAFFPSPTLDEFQNNPDIYDEDEIYGDVIKRSIFPAPLRFDFDRSAAKNVTHPMSHLTIGQYGNCRIPVLSPLSPFLFTDFILQSFYNCGYKNFSKKIRTMKERFTSTITDSEKEIIHISIPL